MTPQEIVDYKQKWIPKGKSIGLHTDLRQQGRTWCKQNLQQHQWAYTAYSDVYQDSFIFESASIAKLFYYEMQPYSKELN